MRTSSETFQTKKKSQQSDKTGVLSLEKKTKLTFTYWNVAIWINNDIEKSKWPLLTNFLCNLEFLLCKVTKQDRERWLQTHNTKQASNRSLSPKTGKICIWVYQIKLSQLIIAPLWGTQVFKRLTVPSHLVRPSTTTDEQSQEMQKLAVRSQGPQIKSCCSCSHSVTQHHTHKTHTWFLTIFQIDF